MSPLRKIENWWDSHSKLERWTLVAVALFVWLCTR
jgi:cytochrome b